MSAALYLGVPLISLITVGTLQFTGSRAVASTLKLAFAIDLLFVGLSVVGMLLWSDYWLAAYAAGCAGIIGMTRARRRTELRS